MSIIRCKKKRHPYVQIDKIPLLDKRLSWKARGLLAYLMTKPDDWEISVTNLINSSDRDGREAVQSGLKELETVGYVVRQKAQDARGRFTGWDTLIFETPEDASDYINNRQPENPSIGETDNRQADYRHHRKRENRQSVSPSSENPPQLINDHPLINDLTNSPSIPQGEPEPEREEKTQTTTTGSKRTPLAALSNQSELPGKEATNLGVDKCSALSVALGSCKQYGTQELNGKTFNRKRTVKRFNRTAVKRDWEIQPGVPYPAFVKWRSQHYIKQGGHWADTPLANASSEIRNNPLRAADLWAQFLTYSNQAFDNALAASAAGMTPKLPECFIDSEPVAKEVVIPKLEALASFSSSKLSGCTAATTSYIAGEKKEASATKLLEPEPTTAIRSDYHQESAPPDYQEQQENIKRLAQLTQVVTSKPSLHQRQPKATSQFEKMRSWLHGGDPVLRQEAITWACKRSEIELLFDEEGNAYDFQVIE